LELTLCSTLPYGLELMFYKNFKQEVVEKRCKFEIFHFPNIVVGSPVESKGRVRMEMTAPENTKPFLHSLSKLTEAVLPDGKIPIVELAKLFHNVKDYTVTHYNNIVANENRYSVNCCVENDNSRYMYFQVNTKVIQESAEIFEKLKEWHFNVYGLSPENYIEKSTVSL